MGSHRPGRDDRPNLTLKAVEGTVIAMDLDRFGEYVRMHGLSSYSPNIVSGTLSHLVEWFIRKWSGVLVYGLDWERGTEEAIIEVPYVDPSEVRADLRRIYEEIRSMGVGISIVAIRDYVLCRPAKSRREAYYGTVGRRRALKLLKMVKRRGLGLYIP